MIVLVPKTSGFCPGVQRAEDGVFKLKESSEYVNLYGPLIHNQDYIEMLQKHQIYSVDIDTLSSGETLVIRTHGVDRNIESQLSQKFILKDMTCPIVKRVQKHIEKATQEKAFVIISGKENHAEVQGLISYADASIVIENTEQLQIFLESYQQIIPQDREYIFILSQTTHSKAFFESLCQQIQKNITKLPIQIKDTICPITENKEKESLILQQEVDFSIVIGDPNSSNSKKLYNILKQASDQTIFIKNLSHLRQEKKCWDNIHKVLVVSSTSTPRYIEQEIVEYLEQLEN